MDRISDSGSDDYGSTPYGDTLKLGVAKCKFATPILILEAA